MKNSKKLSEALAFKVIKELVKEALDEAHAEETGADVFGDQIATMMPNEIDESDDSELDEKAPPGWEGTVKAMKKHKDIKNPWALAWSMKSKGAHPHKK